jgi:hypothetical protein
MVIERADIAVIPGRESEFETTPAMEHFQQVLPAS